MAYGIYYRRGKNDAFKRLTEFYVPTRKTKFSVMNNGIRGSYRDIRCETEQEAREGAAKQINLDKYEIKIKEVR